MEGFTTEYSEHGEETSKYSVSLKNRKPVERVPLASCQC
jgi:hypothetical protein